MQSFISGYYSKKVVYSHDADSKPEEVWLYISQTMHCLNTKVPGLLPGPAQYRALSFSGSRDIRRRPPSIGRRLASTAPAGHTRTQL